MRVIIVLIVNCVILLGALEAQDQTGSSTIYLKSKFFGAAYIKNGVEYKLRGLKNEIKDEPDSLVLFSKWRKYGNVTMIFWYCSFASLYGAYYFGFERDGFHYGVGTKNDSLWAWGLLIAAIGFEIPMIIFNNKASNALQECIWTHNRHVVQREGVKTSFFIDPVNQKGGLGLSLRY